MFRRWASHEFSTDWGTRDVGEQEAVYDPISYHQGSVWPLFTGWEALAEYRSGHALAGYMHLMENANLTTAQDLGAVTELLSGAYFDPFGRSTSHQLWSSAMVLVPAVRGLFGVSIDAFTGVVTVNPHLPAQWSTVKLHNLRIGKESIDLQFNRVGQTMRILLVPRQDTSTIQLASTVSGAKNSGNRRQLSLPLPAVEVGLPYGADGALPLPGAATESMKILNEQSQPRQLTLTLEARAGATEDLYFRSNNSKLHVIADGAILRASSMAVHFPSGSGYKQATVTLRW